MEPYGGDCLEVIFCLWILMLNKELRTHGDLNHSISSEIIEDYDKSNTEGYFACMHHRHVIIIAIMAVF